MSGIPQRPDWHPTDSQQRLTPAWRMWKADRLATCELFSHQFGWELRLIIGNDLLQSRVVRTETEVNAIAIESREPMHTKAWTLEE